MAAPALALDGRLRAARIRGRAIRRCGELLKAMEPQPGKRTDIPVVTAVQPRGDVPPRSRTEAARDAGLSRDQQKTALRVGSIPAEDFEEAPSVATRRQRLCVLCAPKK